MKAVIDRFEGDLAVLLVGDEQRKLDVSRHLLPAEAAEGDWLEIELQNGRVVRATMDRDATIKARERIMTKLERLRRGDHRHHCEDR